MWRRSCSDRPVAYTFAPALASSRAMPRPTPLLAPVTMATLPCSVCILRLYDAGSGRVLEKSSSGTHLRTDAGDHRLHPNEFATFSVSDRRPGEQVEHLRRGRRLQDVTGREVFWPRKDRPSNPFCRLLQILGRVLKLDVRSEQQPIGTGFTERHAHTASVHNTRLADEPVELHVRM